MGGNKFCNMPSPFPPQSIFLHNLVWCSYLLFIFIYWTIHGFSVVSFAMVLAFLELLHSYSEVFDFPFSITWVFDTFFQLILLLQSSCLNTNAVLIAYGSFGSPFLTFDCMNASGAFALISIVISKALLLCILIPFRCSNWLILSFSKIDCTGILNMFLVMLMLKFAIHFPLSHLEFSKRPLPLWLLLLHLLHC